MSSFIKSFAICFALTFITSPASSLVNHCIPPQTWYQGPFGGACVIPVNALKPSFPDVGPSIHNDSATHANPSLEGIPLHNRQQVSPPPTDYIVTLTPRPGTPVNVQGIYEALGRPANALAIKDEDGQPSLQLKGIHAQQLPAVLKTLGINTK